MAPKATATDEPVELAATPEPAAVEVAGEGVGQWTPPVPIPGPEGTVRVYAHVCVMGLAAFETGDVSNSAELRACAERGIVDILE